KATVGMLETFLKNTGTQRHKDTKADSPWTRLDRAYAANRQYLAAAKLFDAGKKSEAMRALDELLQKDPAYPFALTLKRMMCRMASTQSHRPRTRMTEPLCPAC